MEEKEMTEDKYEQLVLRAMESFLQVDGLTSHQVHSYEHFLHHSLPEIIYEQSPVRIVSKDGEWHHSISLSHMHIVKPTIKEANGFLRRLLPLEAHLRKETYAFDVFVRLTHKLYKRVTDGKYRLVEHRICHNVLLFKVPCMLNSSACHTNSDFSHPARESGTFVINGNERVLISQERLATNRPFVFEIKKTSKFAYRCEVRASHARKIRSTSTLNIYITTEKATSVPEVVLELPFQRKNFIPLIIVFRMIGVREVDEMMYFILDTVAGTSPALRYRTQSILLADTSGMTAQSTVEELCDWISQNGGVSTEKKRQKQVDSIRGLFAGEFLPHCGDNKSKAFHLGIYVRKLLMVFLEEIPPDDIYHYTNNRCSTAGWRMALLTRQLVRSSFKSFRHQVQKAHSSGKHVNIVDYINDRKVTAGLRYACATGNWGVQKTGTKQMGCSQVVNDTNLLARYSHARQINMPVNRDGKQPKPRQLHPSHFGILCGAETPEGKAVGLLNQLAFTARVRVGCASRFLIDLLLSDMKVFPIELCTGQRLCNTTLVLVDGIICGAVLDPVELVRTYAQYKEWHSVPIDSNITFRAAENEISILTEQEECYRPLIRLDRIHLFDKVVRQFGAFRHLLWPQLLLSGVVEYVNKEQEMTLNIAMGLADVLAASSSSSSSSSSSVKGGVSNAKTHLELHPSLSMFGVCAGVIPFAHHNHACRNIYQAGMGKQAIAGMPRAFPRRMDKKSHILWYPQRPPVTTMTAHLVGVDSEPAGQSCIVLFASMNFNQEDAVILNEDSVSRGLFRSEFVKVLIDREAVHGAEEERFVRVSPTDPDLRGKHKGSYGKLEADGLVAPGTKLEEGDVMAGKTMELRGGGQHHQHHHYHPEAPIGQKRDKSHDWRSQETGAVHAVMVGAAGQENLRTTRIKTASSRPPEIGDKFSSRHSQKGVCGRMIRTYDMVHTLEGLVPDVIINPHAIPSRMTIGQLLEMLLGEVACIEGNVGDGTAFRGVKAREINAQTLLRNFGRVVLMNGETGHMIETQAFLGVCFYQRLRHMVQDKIHARSRGPNNNLTRQPVEGRNHKGGLRLGEMERDALVSHGSSMVLLERFVHSSDLYKAVVCRRCGFLAEPGAPDDGKVLSVLHSRPYCRKCRSHERIANVEMPYACKLLYQELEALHIGLMLDLED